MSKDDVRGDVRRRDRFRCQYCDKTGEQYAHIVPESDGGEYVLENLLFLCYRCHNDWQEPARASAEMKARLIAISRELRDREKTDGLLDSIFTWPAGERLAVAFGGGMKVIGQERILERKDDPSRPYLALGIDDFGRLRLNAYFDDAEGNDFMHVADNILRVHTADAWDIKFNRRAIEFEHADRKMKLRIRQANDFALYVTGNLYLNGGYYEITDGYIRDVNYSNIFQNNVKGYSRTGVLLFPGGVAF